jgi:NADH:ubiquinone oxidoreductase subunit E
VALVVPLRRGDSIQSAFPLENADLTDLEDRSEEIEDLLARAGTDLVNALQTIQREYGFLPRSVLRHLSQRSGIPLARVYGVATFYSSFFLTPRGKHVLRVCCGTACHVGGSTRILEALSDDLGIQAGETSEDLQFTLDTVGCVGCCSLAPVIVVGDESYGRLNRTRAVDVAAALRASGDDDVS